MKSNLPITARHNQTHVNRLAREIKAGRWQLTHQGIAFDSGGILIDGQHRLWAIIEAGTPVRLRVFYNEPPENRHVLDSGERRSNLDILRITGRLGDISNRHLATLRAMIAGQTGRIARQSPLEEASLYQAHREAIEFALKNLAVCRPKGVANATVRAVVVRAFYSASAGPLERFCDILKSGVTAGEADNGVILLRDFLMATDEAGRGDSIRRLRYAKTEWALASFLKGKIAQRLCSATEELFPLPETTPDRAAG